MLFAAFGVVLSIKLIKTLLTLKFSKFLLFTFSLADFDNLDEVIFL